MERIADWMEWRGPAPKRKRSNKLNFFSIQSISLIEWKEMSELRSGAFSSSLLQWRGKQTNSSFLWRTEERKEELGLPSLSSIAGYERQRSSAAPPLHSATHHCSITAGLPFLLLMREEEIGAEWSKGRINEWLSENEWIAAGLKIHNPLLRNSQRQLEWRSGCSTTIHSTQSIKKKNKTIYFSFFDFVPFCLLNGMKLKEDIITVIWDYSFWIMKHQLNFLKWNVMELNKNELMWNGRKE